MRHRKVLLLFLLALLLLATGVLAVPLEYRMKAYVVGSGGSSLSGDDFTVQGTVGQPVGGSSSSGGDFRVVSGFWAASRQPSTIVYLPTLVKQ